MRDLSRNFPVDFLFFFYAYIKIYTRNNTKDDGEICTFSRCFHVSLRTWEFRRDKECISRHNLQHLKMIEKRTCLTVRTLKQMTDHRSNLLNLSS